MGRYYKGGNHVHMKRAAQEEKLSEVNRTSGGGSLLRDVVGHRNPSI